jgi:hypothetical protein
MEANIVCLSDVFENGGLDWLIEYEEERVCPHLRGGFVVHSLSFVRSIVIMRWMTCFKVSIYSCVYQGYTKC